MPQHYFPLDQKTIILSILAPYPKLLNKKYRVFFMSTTKPGEYKVFDFLRHFVNTFEIRLEEDCMLGEIIVFDFANISFEDMTNMTPTLIAKYIAIYKVCGRKKVLCVTFK